ncbi:MAG: hypothetical protein D9C04_01395 [Nitrosopumilus sp. B06]|nr:MAG: hypothetical protein D9C04_01395 [Nitrosopumilus sp. B06]
MRVAVFGVVMLLFVGVMTPAFAHTTVHVEQYEIEAGWGVEPPIVGIRNQLVFKVIERGDAEGTFRGITNVFKDVSATVVFGGVTKNLEINSDPRPGYYYSPIIPTSTGTYMVELEGDIQGILVDVTIPIEDVEPTSVLDFPPGGSGGEDTTALKNAISALQQDVLNLKSGDQPVDGGASYDIAILGLSIAGAAIVLAVVSMIKRK